MERDYNRGVNKSTGQEKLMDRSLSFFHLAQG